MKSQISRRSFLKGTLAGAVGIAASGVLGACSEPATTTTEAPAPGTTAAPVPETTAPVSEPVVETPAAKAAPYTSRMRPPERMPPGS